jgi:hypothetical protein
MQGSGLPAQDAAMSQRIDAMMKLIEAAFAGGPYLLGARGPTGAAAGDCQGISGFFSAPNVLK